MSLKPKLFLIDANAFCYRAFFAIKGLASSYGQPTNAVYGFVTMLNKLIKTQVPDYIAASFDLKAPTFRHEKFKDYKIKRPPMPEGLINQMPLIKEMLSAYNIPIFELERFEADDVIATLAKRMVKLGVDVYIVTGDKDMLQLVDKSIKVYNPYYKEGMIYDEAKVRERFGVEPAMIVEVMSLMGDTSDNIPGVPGIGEKTAVRLIRRFKSLENLLSNVEEIEKEKLRGLLKDYKKQARLSRELSCVDVSVPINKVELDSLRRSAPNKERLVELFRRLEFKTLLKGLIQEQGFRREDKIDYKLLSNKDEFLDFLKKLEKKREFAFNLHTEDTQSPLSGRLKGISFSWKPAQAYNVSLSALNPAFVLDRLKPIFEDKNKEKLGYNVKYEKIILARKAIDLKPPLFDIMVASYLLNPSGKALELVDLSLDYLGVTLNESLADSSKCAEIIFRLKEALDGLLKKRELDELFRNVEMPLLEVLADMELNGVGIDKEVLEGMSKDLEKTLNRLKSRIYSLAGSHFNINSPKQLSKILFDKLKLPKLKKTKTGTSTDVEVLKSLAEDNELPAVILEYRELNKLKSTYIDALPKLINPKTGKVHTSFNQTVTATGRLSSSSPNLQNIPIKGEMGRRIRKAFLPGEKDAYLLAADYSQIELRILAHLSGDEALIKAFCKDKDIHRHTASLVFEVEEEDVSERMRNTAKTVNFGIIYGMSAYGLSKELGIEKEEAGKFIDSYFRRYPKVKLYIEKQINEARNKGYVTTLLNRRRYIPEINSENLNLRQFAERVAVNTPIQGTAADLIKVAMVNIHQELKKGNFSSKMLLQVHDELLFEVPKGELEDIRDLIKKRMEGVVKLNIPIKVVINVGRNWLEMEER